MPNTKKPNTEKPSNSGPERSAKMNDFVEFSHPSVQLAFQRLGRLLQIKGVKLDQIETVVLKGQYKANQSISIEQLQQIVQKLLALTPEESLILARFLVEEKDEEDSSMTKIQLDMKRHVNSQYIPVRLMTNFTSYPQIYSDSDEKAIKQKF